jgi:hypothetical protein
VGGFLAAFTIEGALFIWAGMSLVLAGVLFRTRLPLFAILVLAVAVFAALTSYTFFVYPG